MKKRILYVGDLNSYSRSYHLYQAMGELPVQVDGISIAPVGEVPGISLKPSFKTRVLQKLGFPEDVTRANVQIIEFIKQRGCPDVLWLHKAITVYPRTLAEARRRCPSMKVVFSSVDNMLKRHSQSVYFRRFAPMIDVFYTKWMPSWAAFKALGFREIREFPFGYNRNFYTPRPEGLSYNYDVTFIGTYEQQRFESLKYLAMNGITITVFGNEWPTNIDPALKSRLQIQYRPVFENDFVDVMHRSKIALNFLRKINDDAISSRSLDTPATGTFMLAERTPPHQKLFEEGKEAEFFGSDEELLQKIHYYLAHEEERAQIASMGRRRCETSGYSYQDRIAAMLCELDVI
jgi:spore maturation protein CgeB